MLQLQELRQNCQLSVPQHLQWPPATPVDGLMYRHSEVDLG